MTNRLVICKYIRRTVYFSLPVIAVRVSGGHLCEAEAPTEPAGETAVRCVAIRFPSPSSLRSRVNGCGNPFSLKGYTDSFTLRVQNDKPFGNLQTHKACGMTAKNQISGLQYADRIFLKLYILIYGEMRAKL